MGRPKLKTRKVPVKLTFAPAFRAKVEAFAFDQDTSISELAETLLTKEMERQGFTKEKE